MRRFDVDFGGAYSQNFGSSMKNSLDLNSFKKQDIISEKIYLV